MSTTLLMRVLRARRPDESRPRLLAALNPADAVADAAVRGLLDDLSTPVETPADGVRRLIGDGEFALAQLLINSPLAHLTEDERTALDHACEAGRGQAWTLISRRHHLLAARARRVRLPELPDADLPVAERRAVAETRLDRWEETITAAEAARRAELEQTLKHSPDAANEERASAIRACLAAGQFAAAEQLLIRGPDGHGYHSPAAVPRPEHWPWPDMSVDTLLDWYASDCGELGFNDRWNPRGSGEAADLLAGLRSLHAGVTAQSATGFLRALDRFLDVGEVEHSIEEVAGGVRTELVGLPHPVLPGLGLPQRMHMYIAMHDWTLPDGGPRPAVLFTPDVLAPAAAHPGLAVFTPMTLFRLLKPTDGGLVPPSARRLNLLREICRQLRLVDLAGDKGLDGHDLSWFLDLLGVAADPGVLDTLMYDTGGHPLALHSALRAFTDPVTRAARLTHDDLAAWRYDVNAMADLRRGVFASLDDPAQAVLGVVLWDHGGHDVEITEDDIGYLLGEIGKVFDDHMLDVRAAAARLVRAGMLERTGAHAYRFTGQGLADLLRDSAEGCELVVRQAVERLSERRRQVLESICLHLSSEAMRHLSVNEIAGLRETLYFLKEQFEAERPNLDQARQSIDVAVTAVDKLLVRGTVSREDAAKLLEEETFDLVELVTQLVNGAGLGRRVPPSLRRRASAAMVRLSPYVVRVAIENILNNAIRAVESHQGNPAQVTVGLDVDGAYTVIDIEDSGPGLPSDLLGPDLWRPKERAEGGRALGLHHAWIHVAHCGGTIAEGRSARFGGARFTLRFPLLTEQVEGPERPAAS